MESEGKKHNRAHSEQEVSLRADPHTTCYDFSLNIRQPKTTRERQIPTWMSDTCINKKNSRTQRKQHIEGAKEKLTKKV